MPAARAEATTRVVASISAEKSAASGIESPGSVNARVKSTTTTAGAAPKPSTLVSPRRSFSASSSFSWCKKSDKIAAI